MLVPKFSLKYGVMMVAMLMLTACQSVKPATHEPNEPYQTVIPQSAKSLFDNADKSHTAKANALQALNEHLQSERFVVSNYYYQTVPLYKKDSLDKDADGIWASFFKVREYRQNKNNINAEAFRTLSDYLLDPSTDSIESALGELPYLRYDDEMANKNPSTISRAQAMLEEDNVYMQTNKEISKFQDDIQECEYAAKYDLDDLIENNPKIDNKNKEVQAIQKKLNQCQKTTIKTSNQLLKKAQGYQKGNILHINSCLNEYKTGLAEIMQPNRTPKSLEGDFLGHYEALHYNFAQCQKHYLIAQGLEPIYYIDKGYTKKFLDTTSQIKQCSQDRLDRQNALRNMGKNYTHNADEFSQNLVNYATCAGSAIDDQMDEATSFDQAKEYLADINYYLLNVDSSLQNRRQDRSITGWLKSYQEMKEQGEQKQKTKGEFYDSFLKSMLSNLLTYIKKTPQQIQAQNIYQNNHTMITGLWHHNPKQYQASGLMSLDFESATAKQSVQLPIEFDFRQGLIRTDLSAALPLVAFVNADYAPLPDEVAKGQMYFKLPEPLSQKIPINVIYEAANEGILAGFKELNDQSFTVIDPSEDQFAQEVGAAQVIKINLGSKEQGKILDAIAKKTVSQLKHYVDTHADFYPDSTKKTNKKPTPDKLKQVIDNFAILSQAHRGNDVGGLAQILEGILPFSLTQNSYLYLDASNKLIAVQTFTAIDNDVLDVSQQSVNQIRFDQNMFNAHPLATKFHQSFDEDTAYTFDGGDWLKNKMDEYRLKNQAAQARESYFDEDDN